MTSIGVFDDIRGDERIVPDSELSPPAIVIVIVGFHFVHITTIITIISYIYLELLGR